MVNLSRGVNNKRGDSQHWQAADGAELCREGAAAGVGGNRALAILSQLVREEFKNQRTEFLDRH